MEIPHPTLLTGSGFQAPTSGDFITFYGLDISNLTKAYCNNELSSITLQDYIYISFSFPVIFTTPFNSRPLINVLIHNTNFASAALVNLVSPTPPPPPISTQGASLHFIQAGPSKVTVDGCNINLVLGFNIGQFATNQTGAIDLPNLTSIVNSVVSFMEFDLMAMG